MEQKILDILLKISPEKKFVDSKNFILDGLLDSFDVILITSAIEGVFKIEISGDEITPENFSSLRSLEELILRSAKKANL
jgi:acyl carrier protein